MPSEFTAQISLDDSRDMAGDSRREISRDHISPMFESFKAGFAPAFAGKAPDTAEENIQAGVRGTLLMALSTSSARWWSPPATKSEKWRWGIPRCMAIRPAAMRSCPNVSKTLVYRLCHFRNGLSRVIPDARYYAAPQRRTAARSEGSGFAARLRRPRSDRGTLWSRTVRSSGDHWLTWGLPRPSVKRVTRLLKINS